MVFSSPVFLFLFLPIMLAAYHAPALKVLWAGGAAGRGVEYRNAALLLGSLLFYAWGEPVFVFVLMGEVVANWALALRMAKTVSERRRSALLALAVVLDLGLLVAFKYAGFLHRTWLSLIGSTEKPISVELPLGISFFTFQILSYMVDLRRGKVAVQPRLDRLCLYVAMFPQLIAGPIVRYADVEAAILKRHVSPARFIVGVRRFLVGLAKKVLVANYVAVVADNLFLLAEDGVSLSAASAWIGLLAYTLQIYFDFSGYSDMAIGLGAMFGFRFGENFRHPYAATSVTDFWRRWHISLSTWFRDYVYIPLGGNRRSRPRVTLNLLLVWALTGLWHGANWTFLAWGLLHFAALSVERATGTARSRGLAMRAWTLVVVMVGWAIFRSPSLPDAGRYLWMLLGGGGRAFDAMSRAYLVNGGTVLSAGVLLSLPVANALRGALRKLPPPARRAVRFATDFALAASYPLCAAVLFRSAYNPFIYSNF